MFVPPDDDRMRYPDLNIGQTPPITKPTPKKQKRKWLLGGNGSGGGEAVGDGRRVSDSAVKLLLSSPSHTSSQSRVRDFLIRGPSSHDAVANPLKKSEMKHEENSSDDDFGGSSWLENATRQFSIGGLDATRDGRKGGGRRGGLETPVTSSISYRSLFSYGGGGLGGGGDSDFDGLGLVSGDGNGGGGSYGDGGSISGTEPKEIWRIKPPPLHRTEWGSGNIDDSSSLSRDESSHEPSSRSSGDDAQSVEHVRRIQYRDPRPLGGFHILPKLVFVWRRRIGWRRRLRF